MKAYVYLIRVDGVVRYVGKGTGRRKDFHVRRAHQILERRQAGEKVKALKFHNRLAKALSEGLGVTLEVMAQGLTDREAFALEINEIAWREGLWNELPGGEGLTSEFMREKWSDPAYRARQIEHLYRRQTDPEYRSFVAKSVREQWSNPEIKAKMLKSLREAAKTPESRAKRAAASKARAGSPESRARVVRMNNERWSDESNRKEMSKKTRATWESDPERRAKLTEWNHLRWSDPERRARQSEKLKEYHAKRKATKAGLLDI